MRAGPPKVIESLVELLTPPAAREHLLGDLAERYTTPRRYLADALSAVPGAIAGRVLRMVDVQILAIEAGALYLSLLLAAWASVGAAYLCEHLVLLRLLLPVGLAAAVLALREVYACSERRAPALEAGLGVGGALAISHSNAALPASILFSGGALGVVVISTLRKWFPPSGKRPRGEVL